MSTDSQQPTPQYVLPDGTIDWESLWRETGTITGPDLDWHYFGHDSEQIEAIAQDEIGNRQMRIIFDVTERDPNTPENLKWPQYIISLAHAVYSARHGSNSAQYFIALAMNAPLPQGPKPDEVEKLLAICLHNMPAWVLSGRSTTAMTPPNLVVMPKTTSRRRGRPARPITKREKLMMEVYFFRYFYIPVLYPIVAGNANNAQRFAAAGLFLKSPREIEPLSYEIIADIMNIGKNSTSVKVEGVEDALTPDSYRKLCKAAEKEMKNDPKWYENTRLRHIQEQGFDSFGEYTAATQLPQVIDMNRDRMDKILDLMADRAYDWLVKRGKVTKTPETIH